MPKKILIILIILLIVALLIPIPRRLKGGIVEYNAILYSVKKVHTIYSDGSYSKGKQIRILFWTVYDDVEAYDSISDQSEDDET